MLMETFVFLFGLIVGSFINVLVLRLKAGEEKGWESKKIWDDISFTPSHCPQCNHNLSWPDLFPVLSFVFLGGKCRYCKKNISRQYPLVELVCGILFLVAYWQFGFDCWLAAFYAIIFSLLLALFVFDLKYMLISEEVASVCGVFVFFAHFYVYYSQALTPILSWSFWQGFGQYIWPYLLGAAVLALPFFILYVISKEKWMGFGDVELGLLLGFIISLKFVLINFFVAVVLGAIISVALILMGKKTLKSEVPFGPFLIIGNLCALLWGAQILEKYSNYFFVW